MKPAAPLAGTCGLRSALARATRTVLMGGYRTQVEDPIAQDVLRYADLEALERRLAMLGIRRLEPLAGGCFSVVLSAGDQVVRLGLGSLKPRPQIPEVLACDASGCIGAIRFEVLPRVEMTGVNCSDLEAILDSLARRGYYWGDAAVDNVGRYRGRLVVVDPDDLSPSLALDSTLAGDDENELMPR